VGVKRSCAEFHRYAAWTRTKNRVKGFALRGADTRDMFYVYVLHSITDHGLYIGYSTDLKRRLSEHKQGASAATKYRGLRKLIYYEAYIERADAVGRERYLKSGSGRRSCGRSCDIISKIFRRVRPKAFYAGYPAWTRTKNNASKGRCVTITPRGI
jgi:putative endonuclease